MSNFSLFFYIPVKIILLNNDVITGKITNYDNGEILEIEDSINNKTRYIIKTAIIEIEQI